MEKTRISSIHILLENKKKDLAFTFKYCWGEQCAAPIQKEKKMLDSQGWPSRSDFDLLRIRLHTSAHSFLNLSNMCIYHRLTLFFPLYSKAYYEYSYLASRNAYCKTANTDTPNPWRPVQCSKLWVATTFSNAPKLAKD